jgi:type I restriction enzyme S subunit
MQELIKGQASSTTLPILNKSKFSKLPAVVCGRAEQDAVVEIVSSLLDACSQIETDIDANLQKAEALRQAILKKAFAGELVPQDPTDEPAAALLARIRAERAVAAAASARAPKQGRRRNPLGNAPAGRQPSST